MDQPPGAARRAKIIATLGPASCEPEVVRELLRAGMDVARLNCAHGDHAWQRRAIATVREASTALGRETAILLDLAGPKLRTGALRGHAPVRLRAGARLILRHGDGEGDTDYIFTSFDLAGPVQPGGCILISDGLLELRAIESRGGEVICEVVAGGELGEHKGINLPDTDLAVPALTEKDLADLRFGLEQEVDFVALSFVRGPDDVRQLRAAIGAWAEQAGAPAAAETPVIAKLEKPQAIAALEAILDCADGVMVARGDLGVEMAPECVPAVQKRIIAQARRKRVPVITATHMLESMIEHPRPTRAEASDVANAVLDGSDALLLTGETANGRFPVEAVAMMSRIVAAAETVETAPHRRRRREDALSIPETIAAAVAAAAQDLRMAAIAAYTQSGATARQIAGNRPPCPVYALSADPRTRRRMSLYWGVTAVAFEGLSSTDAMLALAEHRLVELGLIASGDILGIVAGTIFGEPGKTNLMRIVVAGPAAAAREAAAGASPARG